MAYGLARTFYNVCSEFPFIADKISGRLEFFDILPQQRARLRYTGEAWEKAISIDLPVQRNPERRLRISPAGIVWGGVLTPLENITAVKFWETEDGGMVVAYQVGRRQYAVCTYQEEVFARIKDALWHAAGVRLLRGMLQNLKEGGVFTSSGCVIDDFGVCLKHRRKSEYIWWGNLRIGNEPGCFCFWDEDDQDIRCSLSYEKHDDAWLVETAMRMLWERGGIRLSAVLGE